jgi:hypothetical protein
MPVRATIAHFSLPFGRTLNVRRAPEQISVRGEEVLVEPSVSHLVSYSRFSTKQAPRDVSLYEILRQFYVANAVRRVSDRIFYDATSPIPRIGRSFWKEKNGTLLVTLSASKLIAKDPHVLNPSQRRTLCSTAPVIGGAST